MNIIVSCLILMFVYSRFQLHLLHVCTFYVKVHIKDSSVGVAHGTATAGFLSLSLRSLSMSDVNISVHKMCWVHRYICECVSMRVYDR